MAEEEKNQEKEEKETNQEKAEEEKNQEKAEELNDIPDNIVVKKFTFHPKKNPEPNDINLLNNPNINSILVENPNINSPNNSSRNSTNNSLNNSPRENSNKTPNNSLIQNMQYSNLKINKKAIMNSISDQKETMILQRILGNVDSEQIKSIVQELRGEYRKLILDKYGNFLCKDLFKNCCQTERDIILKELYPTISEDCLDNYATHPLQTLIEYSFTEEEYKLILYSFNDKNKLFSAANDANGSYVIQKIVERIPQRFRVEFNNIFSSFIEVLCQKRYGIISVKKFLGCTMDENIIKNVMNLIRNKFFDIAKDQFGNYLIQFLLKEWLNFKEGQEIKSLVEKNFDILKKTKCSSFICEKYNELFNKKNSYE